MEGGGLVAAVGAARVVGGQLQRGAGAAELARPVLQLPRALARFQPVALPGGVVGIAHRQFGQGRVRVLAAATRAR